MAILAISIDGEIPMLPELRALDDLPRHTATQVKNQWGDVVRQVTRTGAAAITSHSALEMVLMPAADYEELVRSIAALTAQRQSSLDELTQRFDARLSLLQQPDASARVESLFNARGKLAKRPKAGGSF